MEDFERGSDLEENLHMSLHYAVGKICNENAEGLKVKFSKEFIGTLADLTFRQTGIFAEDLEMFAKHAKRTTINADDVKLLVRRSKTLQEHVNKMAEELSANSVKAKGKKKKNEIGEPSHTIDLD
ncbi:centromere protein S-like isoform X1 [Argiope bruennichi]|uniref:centromere protein S-like isoform X1 n=1 Tax=Argiope bruennichi TaxID=94029 RepID=UPI002495016A|nr:centromere protein S-like isoform X1 [Argiope bruennichi]